MKIVGLKIEKGQVSAAVVVRGFRQAALVESFSRTFGTDAELIEILRERAKDWAGARIVSSIPGPFFSQRMVRFPFSDAKRIEKALPFELEDSIPFPLDDMVIDHTLLGQKPERGAEAPVLAMILPKTVLRKHLDLLAEAGLDPQVIVPSFIGLSSVSSMIATEGLSLVMSGADLCLKSGPMVRACRSVRFGGETPGPLQVIRSLETEFQETLEKAYVLDGNEGATAALNDLGIAVERIVPEFHGKKAEDPVSLGLALSDEVNFRKGEFTYRLADVGVRKRRRVLIAAASVAVLLLGANLGVKFYVVQSSYGKVDREIKELFRQTLPDARQTADPVRQLRDRLEEARKKFGVLGTGASALDVMKAVTEGIPKEVRVAFQEFNLEGDRLRLQGEAGSFESVDKIKAELLKAEPFAEVQVQDTRMGVDNKVKFRMDIKLKQAM